VTTRVCVAVSFALGACQSPPGVALDGPADARLDVLLPDLPRGPAGSLDIGFGEAGLLEGLSWWSDVSAASAVAGTEDNKILVAGHLLDGATGNYQIYVERLLVDGTLDESFGEAGRLVLNVGSGFERVADLLVDRRGRIVLGVVSSKADVMRLTPDGAVDPSFPPLTLDSGGGEGILRLILDDEGRVLVAGNEQGDLVLVRLADDGSLDPDFHGGVPIIQDLGGLEVPRALVAQPDGKLLVGGLSNRGNGPRAGFVARLLPSGALDEGFGRGGSFDSDLLVAGLVQGPAGGVVVLGSSQTFALEVCDLHGVPARRHEALQGGELAARVVQPDGSIVGAGTAGPDDQLDVAVVRWLPSGVVDASFGDGGGVVTAVSPTRADEAADVALMADGRIVVVGYVRHRDDPKTVTVVARYLP
jgi:uncharacterized delta-60 repeat protein